MREPVPRSLPVAPALRDLGLNFVVKFSPVDDFTPVFSFALCAVKHAFVFNFYFKNSYNGLSQDQKLHYDAMVCSS